MATLYFKIGADYENVIRLRDEIKKLENQLRSFGKSTPETQIRQTEERLATTRQEFVRLTTEAAKAGAVMENPCVCRYCLSASALFSSRQFSSAASQTAFAACLSASLCSVTICSICLTSSIRVLLFDDFFVSIFYFLL